MDRKFQVVGLGYCSMDHCCLVPEIPIDAKASILDLLVQGGGPAATAVVAAARLGARTAFLGAVGDDNAGEKILAELRKESVDVSGVVRRTGASSPIAYCWAEAKTGRRSIVWTKGGAMPLQPDEIRREIISSSRILHLDGHQTEAALDAAGQARNESVTVMLDAGTYHPYMDDIMALSNVVIASETFARDFTGGNDLKNALRKIRERGPEWTVITRGKQGALGFDGRNFISQAAFKVNVVDTTGAGDVYHGAFAYRCLSSRDLADIMRFSSAAAAMKCRKLGGRSGIPSAREVGLFMEQDPS